ncbi:MAG: RHS repeat-associated core domain-containing protein, partial [Sulfurovum sp.]|nr:RHS repeat-associated core domain-containing protein [Sulfurovum sp.]
YTGREMDADDLYYYRARYYDPNTQRFLSLDPIGFEAGDFNFYRYVGNDPVNFRDPSGLESCECTMTSEATKSTYPDKNDLIAVDPKVLRENRIQKMLERSQRGVDAGRGIPLMTREQASARVDNIDAMNGKVGDVVGLGLSTASLFNPMGLGVRLGIAALCIDVAQEDEMGILTGGAATIVNHPVTKTADIAYGIWAVVN